MALGLESMFRVFLPPGLFLLLIRLAWRAGQYSYPRSPKVTAECRDLLDRIFKITPKERITLAGIQVPSLAFLGRWAGSR